MAGSMASPIAQPTRPYPVAKPAPCFIYPPRSFTPTSQATDISDSEWLAEASDGESVFEEDSLSESSGPLRRWSGTTTSLSDEARTPSAGQDYPLKVDIRRTPSVQGPTGPHLFRASFDSSKGFTFENALQLSPLLSKTHGLQSDFIFQSPVDIVGPLRPFDDLRPAVAELDGSEVRNWTSQQVTAWMTAAGFEESIVRKFEEHDINGTVLLDLDIQDLKELDIPSFGKRHQIWSGLGILRGDGNVSPTHTPFEDSSRPATRLTNVRERSQSYRWAKEPSEDDDADLCTPRKRRNRRRRNPTNDPVMPGESVSIVAIEQLIPKPHKCSKGKNCPKWRKRQRLRERLDQEYGFAISPVEGGTIFIAGDPGNPESADNLVGDIKRPLSEALPSVVASSDLLGPGQLPELSLQEDVLRNIATRDPQENVKQFLDFQRIQTPTEFLPAIEPPLLETSGPILIPPPPAPLTSLQQLPKLTIPTSPGTEPSQAFSFAAFQSGQTCTPNIYRTGTPASEMDVYLPDLALTPIPRDLSQSVPPNMRFRQPIKHRPGSRDPTSWRRASMVLPTLPENGAIGITSTATPNPTSEAFYGESTTHAGWMNKRKTKLLRHEWLKRHYRLTGTQLAMHASARPDDQKALDTINVDDYFVSCSSRAGNSKLAAALKALHISSAREPEGDTPFGFQLVPAANRARSAREVKTHHFAVQGKDERSDWMREVMLAKAMKQKSEGYSVTRNGETL